MTPEQEIESLKQQLAAYQSALERDRDPKREKWLLELAKTFDPNVIHFGPPTREDMEHAAIELRALALDYTLKANFVPMQLEIAELKATIGKFGATFQKRAEAELELVEGLETEIAELKKQLAQATLQSMAVAGEYERVKNEAKCLEADCAVMRQALENLKDCYACARNTD